MSDDDFGSTVGRDDFGSTVDRDDFGSTIGPDDFGSTVAAPRHFPGRHRGPRFSWNPSFEATFFQSLCESVQQGLREGSTFRSEAWDRAGHALLQRHNAHATKGHLINKSDNARKKFRLWRSLREDSEFQYDANLKMVTATEEAWKRHIEKEPLSRSLKGRPFEHEEYYEILFPDVIGSGGVPKRVTKPRRKPDNGLNESADVTSKNVVDMLADATFDSQAGVSQQTVTASITQSNTIPLQTPPLTAATMSATTLASSAPVDTHPTTALPPQAPIHATSALTPPEETTVNPRKRYSGHDAAGKPSPDKRRRTTTGHVDVETPQKQGDLPHPTLLGYVPRAVPVPVPVPTPLRSKAVDGITSLVETLQKDNYRPTWQERAMDIFFRDFANEDLDLQCKIAEKMLCDENKAMMFCKMPGELRRFWVKRLRDLNNNRDLSSARMV